MTTGAKPFIDRERQLRGFGRLLQPDRPKAVVLVEGLKDMGKTCLIKQWERACTHGRGPIPCAMVNFRNPREIHEVRDVVSLVRFLRNRLGYPEYFSPLNDEINRFTERGSGFPLGALQGLSERMALYFDLANLAQISRRLEVPFEDLPGEKLKTEKAYQLAAYLHRRGRLLELIGELERLRDFVSWRQGLDSLLAAPGALQRRLDDGGAVVHDRGAPLPTDEGQDLAAHRISQAFFECVGRLVADFKPVIFFLDGCEELPPEAKQWICGELLHRLARAELRDVVVILSGRTLPDLSDLAMGHLVERTELDRFDRARVRQLFEAHGFTRDPDYLKAAHELSGGIPGELARMVDRLRAAEDARASIFDE